MTFSIVARSADGQSWGVAVASKFLAVGSAVPAAVAGIGALATQAEANLSWKGIGPARLAEGAPPPAALDRMLEEDPKRNHRQIGIVDVDGLAVTHTGSACYDWAGGVTGDGVAIQGNILTGPEVLDAMKAAWDGSAGEPSLARRLLSALRAGDHAGGDRRGRQSAALLVVSEGAGYGGLDDVAVDLRVDDSVAPIPELARLLDLNDLYLTASSEAEKVEITPQLAGEIDDLVRAAGHPDLASWVGTENYEMRVAEDGTWIDRQILAILRDVS
jgi:uncharacterized Ntn-hydrolase superfamily protein